MLAPLATTADATAFGLTVTEAALLRASTRVRAFTGQQISAGTSTVTLRGPVSRLPQRPVAAIVSILDEDAVEVTAAEWDLTGNILSVPCHTDILTVEYEHGWAVIPDEVVEVVCSVADRLGSADASLSAGVQQEQSGSASQTFGWDAWKALSSLTSEEKAVLLRYFPATPRPPVVMRP